MDLNPTTLIGITASVFTAISLLPQLFKIIREKNAKGTSPFMLGSLFIGLSCWTWYGFLINDYIIVVSNGFSLLVNIAVSLLSIKYHKSYKTEEKKILIGKV